MLRNLCKFKYPSSISTTRRLLRLFSNKKNQQQITVKQGEESQLVDRTYDETDVPGIQDRKYSDLSDFQKNIIQESKFDLLNPEIKPKIGGLNSYVGITDTLTQIDLGKVKVKGQNEVFLSQVDPYNIPEELDIKFDEEKEMKLVGKEGSSEKTDEQTTMMQVQKETFEQKSISELMKQQFGVKIDYQYSKKEKIRNYTFSFILCLLIWVPIIDTLFEVGNCLSSIRDIEKESMKEIEELKKRNMRKTLLKNVDFHNVIG